MAKQPAKIKEKSRKKKPRKKRDMLKFAKKLQEDMHNIFLKKRDMVAAAELQNERLADLTPEEQNEYIEWAGVLNNRPRLNIGM